MRLLPTLPRLFLAVPAVFLAVAAAPEAMADAATHEFRITSAEDFEKADCGNDGDCTVACMLHAELAAVTGGLESEIAVFLNYKNKNVDYADNEVKHSSLQFFFTPSEAGPASETGDHVQGMLCSEVSIDSVEASCLDDACPWIYVQIDAFPGIGLKDQKVEAIEE